MKRTISAVAVALSLGTTAAFADVQTSFPDGYTIVEAESSQLATQNSAAAIDLQTSFPDGYQVVDYSSIETPVSSADEAGKVNQATSSITYPNYFPSGA